MKGSESFRTQKMHAPREHMNIHKFKNCNKLLFSPWSVVAPVRYKRVLYCEENSSYPSLCWKLNFFSFSKHFWNIFFHHGRSLTFTPAPFTSDLLLPVHPQDVILITLKASFWRANPCPHSRRWLPSIPGSSKLHLPALQVYSFPCYFGSHVWLPGWQQGGPSMAFRESWASPLMDSARLPCITMEMKGERRAGTRGKILRAASMFLWA